MNKISIMLWYLSFVVFLCYIRSEEAFYVIEFNRSSAGDGELFQERLRKRLTAEVCMGTPYQCLPFDLDTNTYVSWIVNASLPNHQLASPFNSALSSTFSNKSYEWAFWRQDISKGMTCYDNIKLSNLTFNATLILAKEVSVYNRYGTIGLQYTDSPTDECFMYQLFKRGLISHNQFSLEYTSLNKGRLILGKSSTPSTLLINASYVKSSLYKTYPIVSSNITFAFNGKPQGGLLNIDETFGFIEAPIRSKEFIIDAFKLNDPKCTEQKYQMDDEKSQRKRYYYYLCEKSFSKNAHSIHNYNDFSIQFNQNKTQVIKIDKDELYSEYNATHKIFVIVVKEGDSTNYDWVLGEPILRKYKVVYNIAERMIQFETRDHYSELNHQSIIILFVVFLPGIITMGIIVGMRLYKNNQRKKTMKNNEESLDSEDMDYEKRERLNDGKGIVNTEANDNNRHSVDIGLDDDGDGNNVISSN